MVKRFSLKTRTLAVEVEDVDGTVQAYTLRGLKGRERQRYISFMASKIKVVDGQPAGLKDTEGQEVKLVAMSLSDAQGMNVSEAVIAEWPGDVVNQLFRMCQDLSGLGAQAETQAKNDSGGSTEPGTPSPTD